MKLKYLKKYKLFESTEQDLRDILLELEDIGYRIIYEDDVIGAVTGEPGNVKAIVVRDVLRAGSDEPGIGLPWSELKEYALRIKDYLGDKYLSFMWRKRYFISTNRINSIVDERKYRTIELNEETETNDKIWSFVIKYKE